MHLNKNHKFLDILWSPFQTNEATRLGDPTDKFFCLGSDRQPVLDNDIVLCSLHTFVTTHGIHDCAGFFA